MKGHTLILQGGSPVLAAMFENDMTQSSTRTIIIEDVEPDLFRQLLRYLYTGDVHPLMEVRAEEFLIASANYQVNSLKNWCGSVLSKSINEKNVVRLLILANLYPPVWLQEDCIDFIVKNKRHFFANNDLRSLGRHYPDLFFEITKRCITK
jgi:speckle-type POZ protein